MKTKYARWILTPIRNAATRTMRASLRGGKKGTGKVIGSYQYWPESFKSCEMGDDIATHIEADAMADGYTILPAGQGETQ